MTNPSLPPFEWTPPTDGPAVATSEDRNWAMAAHLGVLVAAWVALGFLAPLVVLLVAGNRSDFVRRHAVESLNFQISLLIYLAVASIAAFLVAVVTLGLAVIALIPVAAVLAVTILVLIIMATMAASNGEDYRYPLCLRFVS